ncbi:Glycogen synthase [Rubripirellula obstinata]|uniref:Glycogen synthase n=1 Tax=Rubripirellula obstinata TaxID=406547 RepID=A0A5B1CK23_9BACT|nr:glycosyltransferase family 4 protein [Rubripirellula obstinata]KAA1260079.1 Glycogen synthase [Rubripirellula obstinata]
MPSHSDATTVDTTSATANLVLPSSGQLSSTSVGSDGAIEKISVLHVVNGEHFSGAERVQSHLGRCLPEFGVTADFASVKPGKFAEMVTQQGGAWGRGYFTPMKHRFDLHAAKSICKIIDDERYDLLHAHTPRSAMITAFASKMSGVPWIYHVHSPAARDSAKAFTNRLNAWIEKLALRTCSRLITVSASLREDCIASGSAPAKVSVVHNGVPAVRPPRTHTPKPGGRWVMGLIALQRPRKGLEFALEAVAKLRGNGHDVVLRIIGPYETEAYRRSIEDQIDRLRLHEGIEEVGFTTDVPAELVKLDAMLLPSLFGEGLPMVVLEAMAAAVPVIATSVEGTPEAVTHGVEGLLAQPRDAESLAQAISELVTGKYDWTKMSEAAFTTHADKFSDKAMAAGTAAVYRDVLAK